MSNERPIVLSIAGWDPCGGAGVLADVKTMEQLQVQGMAVVTAMTIQTEDTFNKLDWQCLEDVLQGIEVLMQRYRIAVVKIGIVPGCEFLKAIVHTVRACNAAAWMVWDPVLQSSSGFQFFSNDGLHALPEVLPGINLVTPNYLEYQLLKAYLRTDTHTALLVKGGHRPVGKGVDVLIQGGQEWTLPPGAGSVYAKHGSGCVLSAAIAARLAWGDSLLEACRSGKVYTEQFLKSTPALLGYHHYAE